MSKKTPLYAVHVEKGAKMVDFAGWSMPVLYDSIISEHNAVRQGCGIFDVSHMGEFLFRGPNALDAVDYLISNNLKKVGLNKGVYSPLLYKNGTFVDDVIAYALADDVVWMVVNASNIEKDEKWIRSCLDEVKDKFSVTMEDYSAKMSLLAIQGKNSENIIGKLFPDLKNKEPFSFSQTSFLDKDGKSRNASVARTGYTGEAGVEVMLANEDAIPLFLRALDLGAKPCGLGSRDTLRLEKGYSLYGNEIDQTVNPLESGLAWTVDFEKDFVGKEALLQIKQKLKTEPGRRLKGFTLLERSVARHGCLAYSLDEKEIGIVTSGAFSPTLKKSIGLVFVPGDYKDKEILIDIRGKKFKATLGKRVFC